MTIGDGTSTGWAKRRTGNLRFALLTATALCFALPVGYARAAPAVEAQAFAIPPGPLTPALNRLAAETGLQIMFDAALANGKRTLGAEGSMTREAALSSLLAGTGLSASFADGDAVTLVADTTTFGAPVDSGAAEGEAIVLDTVTLSGEKIGRDMFRTYSSVGVVTAEEIEDANPRDLDQALDRLANVRAVPTGSGNNNFVIRGLNAEGVTQSARSSPIISVIIDGAIQNVEATRRGSRGIWDVEQVEVLRGPQSTLQGRDALGGSIVVKTKDPTFEPEAVFNGAFGSGDLASGAFAVSAPLIADQVAVRIAGQATKSRKDIEYADQRLAALGRDEFEEVRAKLLIAPTELPEFKGLFTIARTHDKPGWSYVTGPDFFARRFEDASASAAEFRDTYVDRYISDLSYELAPDWTLTSVTAVAASKLDIASPQGASFERADRREGRDISQDVRLAFEPADLPVSGVVGLFAGRFSNDVDSVIDTDQLASFGLPGLNVQTLQSETATTSFAAYGDLRYRFLDRWTLIGGGRVLKDKVESKFDGEALDLTGTLESVFQCAVIGCAPSAVFGSLDEDTSVSNPVVLPKIGLAFDLADNQTIGATATRGYRSGFAEAVPGSTVINEIDPEYLWSYDLAYRSRWLDDRLEINANTFYYDYQNQQILTVNPNFTSQTITQNGGQSHAYGAEVELRWKPVESVQLFSSVGLLKTEFDDAVTTVGNLKGKEFPNAPAFTAAAGATWRHETGLFVEADASYTDGFYSTGDIRNTPSRMVDGFTLVNAQIGYEAENGKLSVFARNLFDEEYLTSIDVDRAGASVGDGRTFGLSGTLRF